MAQKVIGEIELDMSRRPTTGHFASWLGFESEQSHHWRDDHQLRDKLSANRASKALRLAANGLHRSDSPLGAFLRRKKTHLGSPKAITATARKLAGIIYTTLKHGCKRRRLGLLKKSP